MKNPKSRMPFPLQPLKVAKVSEISEATQAVPIPANKKINFHIGNPLQDDRLVDMYFSLCSGFPKSVLDENEPALADQNPVQREQLAFIYSAIKNAVPYLPRGGFAAGQIPQLVKNIQDWLSGQQEPLQYSFGEKSDRECILSSGGKYEFVRVLFSALSRFSVQFPIRVVTIDFKLPDYLNGFFGVELFREIEGPQLKNNFQDLFDQLKGQPVLVLLGKVLNENERRDLRKSSQKNSVLFVELFDAPNHQSLARESGLKYSVIRFLTAAVFNNRLANNAIQFVLGNAAILKRIESVHFELKGTPSSTEKDLLEFQLNHPASPEKEKTSVPLSAEKGQGRFYENENIKDVPVLKFAENKLASFSKYAEKYSEAVQVKAQKQWAHLSERFNKNYPDDSYGAKSATGLFSSLTHNNLPDIEGAFLGQFIKHKPQYSRINCFAISGSSRTALSLLGHHCGIDEIITFDWSWSYENGFERVITVPLFIGEQLNTEGLLGKVARRLKQDDQWKSYGAVVLNNPHNASGNILNEPAITNLLINLLDQNIIVIDDLCYQDVAPSKTEVKILTLKELALEAVKKGLLPASKLSFLITMHALSKTDCFAGARLTVAEITDPQLKSQFTEIKKFLQPNTMALFLAYLFYRNNPDDLRRFWATRNFIFAERAEGIKSAFDAFPAERNPYQICVKLPTGSMYPHLIINKLPQGIATENISLKLAQRGIGLVPLTAFSKSKRGYALARNRFRLSLGGKDDAEVLKNKTRRLIIELNRLIDEESRDYIVLGHGMVGEETILPVFEKAKNRWAEFVSEIEQKAAANFKKVAMGLDALDCENSFKNNFLPWRTTILNQRFNDYLKLYSKLIVRVQSQSGQKTASQLKDELAKDVFEQRQTQFQERLFDRTVHPTQMYALTVDVLVNAVFDDLFFEPGKMVDNAAEIATEIVKEYFGLNIPVNSEQEAHELIYDLKAMVQTELYAPHGTKNLLSFWGDWDGSTRPSGQGHRLVAAVLLENVKQMARFIKKLHRLDPSIKMDPALMVKINNLQKGIDKFWKLLNKITRLTNQLEKKYKGLLPTALHGSRLRRVAVNLKLRRDPLTVLVSHNSRLEKTMLNLRQQRKSSLEYYFELNKTLRKKLNFLIPKIVENIDDQQIALLAASYKNLLSRFVLTPRIHQKTVTSKDPFTIENTVHNLLEINQIGARFGNPGLIMALQISMSSNARALIELSRLITSKTELINRENNTPFLFGFWLIPLFEEEQIINNLHDYLNQVWTFAEQSRTIKQAVGERFQEILCEIFVAGSDLSQQVGQAKSWELFKETKFFFYKWLAEKGLIGTLRIKLGCGEPMQRQGGYFTALSGKSLLDKRLALDLLPKGLLKPYAEKSLQFAAIPLKGLHAGGELRTVQSNAAEHIFRFLDFEERSQLLHHISEIQKLYKNDLLRTGRLFQQSRLNIEERIIGELKRNCCLTDNKILEEFKELSRENFRQILYGKDEDIVGIHAISYFISQMVPTLRDRPTVRPSSDSSNLAGQKIVERIAQTLPLAHHGSLLRAIGHNRAQSMILGVNQLTTGLFRALKIIVDLHGTQKTGRILQELPVMEILQGLRIYGQDGLKYIKKISPAFNTGNSALHALDEDFEYMYEFIPLLQRELIARQGLVPGDYFEKNCFKADLLPFVRPDIAVLLQPDLFNVEMKALVSSFRVVAPKGWLLEMKHLLELPGRIQRWRQKTWDLIGENIFHQVSSFIDLAKALTTLAGSVAGKEAAINLGQSRSSRMINQVNSLLRGAADDSMRQFLHSVVEYISRLPENNDSLPIDTMRVLHDIKRIIKIDEQLLSQKEQSKLRFYILQMARLAGENG